MSTIRTTLNEIATGYALFEKDQVLTHDQLNSISAYLEGQQHRDRVLLHGVGIVSGLRVALTGDTVTLGRGFGMATDGDLLALPADRQYDRYQRYDESRPVYGPFYLPAAGDGATPVMLPVYELIPTGETAPLAKPFATFGAKVGPPGDMVALLYLESFATDRDFCAVADCDNLGQECRTAVRLLLVEKTYAAGLLPDLITPHRAYDTLPPVPYARPLLKNSFTGLGQLAAAYRTAAGKIHEPLVKALHAVYGSLGPLLAEDFPQDPATEWEPMLESHRSAFAAGSTGIQYYHAFLQDLAETWNDFRELLFNDTTIAVPPVDAFPKHLLLGDLVPGPDPAVHRTGFYPSPLTGRSDRWEHARFLLRKIDALIRGFSVPAGGRIRITPTRGQETSLEERAIPWYYPETDTAPIRGRWSYRLAQRRQAPDQPFFEPTGDQTLWDTIGVPGSRYPLFRVEGHLGMKAHDAVDQIRGMINGANLPIGLHSVLLGNDRTKLIPRPGIRYTDLHRLHYLVRQDVSQQLQEVATFSRKFKAQVGAAVRKNDIVDTAAQGAELTNAARDNHEVIAKNTAQARVTLNLNYSAYKANTTLNQNLVPALQSAGQFKSRLSEVVKTDFATPFDALISNPHLKWLGWLDEIITSRDESDNDKLKFGAFVTRHPGLEHAGGVPRGGTFVLLYDETQTVVGDFMVPYYCDDPGEEEPPQPPLTPPVIRPGRLITSGITILSSRDKFVGGKLTEFKDLHLANVITKDLLGAEVQNHLAGFKFEQVDKIQSTIRDGFDRQQQDYLNTMKESVNTMASVVATRGRAATVVAAAAGTGDAKLDQSTADAKSLNRTIGMLEEMIKKDPTTATQYQPVLDGTKEMLADVIAGATLYVAEQAAASKIDVAPGSAGFEAVLELNNGVELIRGSTALSKLTAAVKGLSSQTLTGSLNMLVGNIRMK